VSDDGHVTGYFVRVKRDGRFQSLDLAMLSEAEIREVMKEKSPEALLKWIIALARWIKEAYDSG
jgi:hypothetical protein